MTPVFCLPFALSWRILLALFFPTPRVSLEVLPVEATFFSPNLLQRLSKNVDGGMQKQGMNYEALKSIPVQRLP